MKLVENQSRQGSHLLFSNICTVMHSYVFSGLGKRPWLDLQNNKTTKQRYPRLLFVNFFFYADLQKSS